MNKSFTKNKTRKLLSLCLCAFMFSSVAAFASCGGNSGKEVDDSEVSSTPTDSDRILNGSFEFYDDNDGKSLIITSPKNWSKSTGSSSQGSASPSKTASGIVNTEKWDEYFKSALPAGTAAPKTEEEAKALWSSMNAYDKLQFIQTWEEADKDNDKEDLSFYDSTTDNFNVDFEDIPDCENPGTHYAADATDKDDNTGVLMLHNSYSDHRGTAQKFTSSTTITLEAGTSAQFSLWVKTADLTSANSENDASQDVSLTGERGAYIGVTHTVGGTSLDQVQIKNINTEVLNPDNENNGWVKYEFLFHGCSYASSTFTVVLGLGQGGGGDRWEYVDGYAFFDDVECTVISEDTYNTEIHPWLGANGSVDPSYAHYVTPNSDALQRVVEADKTDLRRCVIDCDVGTLANTWAKLDVTNGTFNAAVTSEEKFGTVTSSKVPAGANDKAAIYTYATLKAAAASGLLNKVFTNDFANVAATADTKATVNYPFTKATDNDQIIMLYSESGAAYEATLQHTAFQLDAKTQNENTYMIVSFFLKTSDMTGGFTGAGVTLTETTNGFKETVLLSSANTDAVKKVEVDGEGEEYEDLYKGWQQYFLVIENASEKNQSFELTFNYGLTSSAIVNSSEKDYRSGYVAFANFKTYEIDKNEFTRISAGDYTKTVTISDGTPTNANGFDSPASVPNDAIETQIATPKNYTGVNGGSAYIVPGANDKTKNSNEYAGLINKDYASAYASKYASLTGITFNDELFGETKQPLLIYNNSNKEAAYGFYGKKQTVTAGNVAAISVKVKVSEGANAFIYLIDQEDYASSTPLSVSTLSYGYWYDAYGNVCSKDPNKNSFDEDKDVAFKLKDHGLYEVNKSWTGYKAEYAGKLFANLQNYEVDEETGNLLVDPDKGVTYNYDSSVYSHQGNDYIAFYAKDDGNGNYTYYAYEDKKEAGRVYDLAEIEGLARYANNKKSISAKMQILGNAKDENNNLLYADKWVDVTFYVKAGDVDKNYRLEVWSGSRDGDVKSAANSYVLFDMNSLTVDATKFDTLINENVEVLQGDMSDEAFRNLPEVAYTAFAFYDSPAFLRYDATLDKEDVGNSYDDYNAVLNNNEGVAFLFNNEAHTLFMDYSFAETEVAPDVETEDKEEEEEETKTPTDGTDFFLLASSIILAAVLLLAIVSVIVRKILKKYRPRAKKAEKTEKKEKPAKAEKKEKAVKNEKAEEKPADEKDPYND